MVKYFQESVRCVAAWEMHGNAGNSTSGNAGESDLRRCYSNYLWQHSTMMYCGNYGIEKVQMENMSRDV